MENSLDKFLELAKQALYSDDISSEDYSALARVAAAVANKDKTLAKTLDNFFNS